MENLGIDIKLLVAQLVNFVLFFIIFKKFIASPFIGFLNKQRKEEQERAAALEKARTIEASLTEKELALKKKMAAEVDEVMKSVKQDAVLVKEDIIENANKEADEIIEKAKKQAGEEKVTMQKEVKNSVADLSVLMVNHVLKEYMSDKEQKQVTARVLKNLDKNLLNDES